MTNQLNIPISCKKTNEYIEKLHQNGAKCYIVGGYVRDYLLGNNQEDLDIEVYNIDFSKMKEIFGNEGEVQGNFGVVALKRTKSEFTIPRYENKIGQKHTDFEINLNPQMSLKEAAIRRDFTVNSIMYDISGKLLIDNYSGLKDLDNKILRHISQKFSEDPLRVLRAIRFSCTLGFTINEETKKLCIDLLDELQYISTSRKYQELTKMINSSPNNFQVGLESIENIFLPYFGVETSLIQESIIENSIWEHTKKSLTLLNLNKENYEFYSYKILFFTILFKAILKIKEKGDLFNKEIIEPIIEGIIMGKKDRKLILSLIEDSICLNNILEIKATDLFYVFKRYNDNFNLLIECEILDRSVNCNSSNDLSKEYSNLQEKYVEIFKVYEKFENYKKQYNGTYYLAKGYQGKAIKEKQEDDQLIFLETELRK